MSWACRCCQGVKGQAILVPYIQPHGGSRQLWPFCSHCDRMDLWPIYTRTAR